MRATDQLAAMDMMAVDPIARVIAPRFMAAVFSVPLLAALFLQQALAARGSSVSN